MKIILVLSLLLIGVLELPITANLEIKPIEIGEVKGEAASLVKVQVSPSPSPFLTPVSSPSPSPSPAALMAVASPTTVSQDDIVETELTPTKIIILDSPKELQDAELMLKFPKLDKLSSNQIWMLKIELEIFSVEDAMGFDSPLLEIKLDEKLAYQHDFSDDQLDEISFNPQLFSDQPHNLSIWSGNTGDEFKNSSVIIKKITLKPEKYTDQIETKPVDDLVVTADNEDYLTLEWSSPQTNDANLPKALAYEIRYASEPITASNWSEATLVEVVLPVTFSPQAVGKKEIALIKSLSSIENLYVAVGSFDSNANLHY